MHTERCERHEKREHRKIRYILFGCYARVFEAHHQKWNMHPTNACNSLVFLYCRKDGEDARILNAVLLVTLICIHMSWTESFARCANSFISTCTCALYVFCQAKPNNLMVELATKDTLPDCYLFLMGLLVCILCEIETHSRCAEFQW